MKLTRLFTYFWAILLVLFAVSVLPTAAAVPVCEYQLDVSVTNQSTRPIGFVPTFFDAATGDDRLFGTEVIVAPAQTGAGTLTGSFDENSVIGGFYYWFDDSVSASDYPIIDVDFTYNIEVSGCGGMDQRLNATDPAALVAIYTSPSADDAYDIYTIAAATGQGTFAQRVTGTEISAAQAACTANSANTLVAEGSGFSLWVIQPCDQLSLNSAYPDGKPYSFLFNIE